jgi:ABC-type phosphate transport system ATPase subunit
MQCPAIPAGFRRNICSMESLQPKHALVSVVYAPQEGYLFSGSVRDNAYVGASSQSLDLQHLAVLHDDVAALPSGVDTGIGERGVRSSGGQRQRLGPSRDAAASPGLLWCSPPRPRSTADIATQPRSSPPLLAVLSLQPQARRRSRQLSSR